MFHNRTNQFLYIYIYIYSMLVYECMCTCECVTRWREEREARMGRPRCKWGDDWCMAYAQQLANSAFEGAA